MNIEYRFVYVYDSSPLNWSFLHSLPQAILELFYLLTTWLDYIMPSTEAVSQSFESQFA